MDIVEIDCSTGEQITRPASPQEIEQAGKDAQADQNHAWVRLRNQRDALLFGSEWSQMPDTALAPGAVADWRRYRQELRDIPAHTQDPYNPVWPTPPPKP